MEACTRRQCRRLNFARSCLCSSATFASEPTIDWGAETNLGPSFRSMPRGPLRLGRFCPCGRERGRNPRPQRNAIRPIGNRPDSLTYRFDTLEPHIHRTSAGISCRFEHLIGGDSLNHDHLIDDSLARLGDIGRHPPATAAKSRPARSAALADGRQKPRRRPLSRTCITRSSQ